MSYQDIKDRLHHGHRKVANNTYLKLVYYQDEEWIEMALHGNIVAEFYPNYLKLYSGGWYTTTTKDRLNLALRLAGIPYFIRQRNYRWYYGYYNLCVAEFKDGMKLSYNGKEVSHAGKDIQSQ